MGKAHESIMPSRLISPSKSLNIFTLVNNTPMAYIGLHCVLDPPPPPHTIIPPPPKKMNLCEIRKNKCRGDFDFFKNL